MSDVFSFVQRYLLSLSTNLSLLSVHISLSSLSLPICPYICSLFLLTHIIFLFFTHICCISFYFSSHFYYMCVLTLYTYLLHISLFDIYRNIYMCSIFLHIIVVYLFYLFYLILSLFTYLFSPHTDPCICFLSLLFTYTYLTLVHIDFQEDNIGVLKAQLPIHRGNSTTGSTPKQEKTQSQ